MINFNHLFIYEIELFKEVNIYDQIIQKILKMLYLTSLS